MYFLQEKLTNFNMEVSKHFELFQVFMHNFFVKMSRYSCYVYISYKKINTFSWKGFDEFWGYWDIFESKESYKKNRQNSQ